MGTAAYEATAINGVWTGRLNRSSDRTFYEPLKRRKPQTYFVNSMSDFWHEDAKDEWRIEAMDIMDRTPQHTYQILTKRPENSIDDGQQMEIPAERMAWRVRREPQAHRSD